MWCKNYYIWCSVLSRVAWDVFSIPATYLFYRATLIIIENTKSKHFHLAALKFWLLKLNRLN